MKQYMNYFNTVVVNYKAPLSTYSVLFSRFTRFAVVGLSGVLVDLGTFYFLHSSLCFTLTMSAMLSTEIAIINNFIWNDLWTFNDVSYQLKNNHRLQRLLKFNLICLVGLVLNSLIVSLLFYKFQVNEYIAKLMAIACVTLWNFWLNLKINWQQVRE
ncbi:GtrA family protein [Brasilonema sp. CT11]|nr:GtrA family protein [Brasilonema sp. CT11]